MNLNQVLNMNINTFIKNFAPAIIGIVLILWIMWRQTRPMVVKFKLRTYVILMVIGLVEVNGAKSDFHWTVAFVLIIALYSLVLPFVFGILRALTYKFWLADNDRVMRRGNFLTILLWVIYAIGHFTLDHFSHQPMNIFLLFDIGFSLMVQRYYAYRFASRKFPKEIENNFQTEK